jgi:hypothetical protein
VTAPAAPLRPADFTALAEQLHDLGVELPEQVARTCEILAAAATGELKRECEHAQPEDLLSLDRAGLAAAIRAHAAATIVRDRLTDSVWAVTTQLLDAAADVLRDHADDIIDQLRARFDTAVTAVRAAAQLGIHPGATAADVIGLGAKAVTAWQTLPEHARVLDDIASARVAMADVLTIEPLPNPFGARQYGAAFSPMSPRWESDRFEGSIDRWLRLAQAGPLRLQSLAETADTDNETRVIPPPIAAGNANAEAPSRAMVG